MRLHYRLGHLNLDEIERMGRNPGSGVKITDFTRKTCNSCAEGKQPKNRQAQADSGENSPIDVPGGVICSDLKGPMQPVDRMGNRYMINLIDHHTNYCKIFLAKTKVQAAKYFEHFQPEFERRFGYKVQVLRTDGGDEYRFLDHYCASLGIRRQISEARNQASNGKAERMHDTLLNMARSMIFKANLEFHFWGDALQYACYILNRIPSKSNTGRKSPLKTLTQKPQDLPRVVVFGSSCTVHVESRGAWSKRAKQGRILGTSEGRRDIGSISRKTGLLWSHNT